jgi:hypothetical protein
MRWIVLSTVLLFGVGVGVAPVPHFAEDGSEISDYLASAAQFEAHLSGASYSASPKEPLPPSHPIPDDVDCLFCLLLVAPATVGGVPPVPLGDASTTPPQLAELAREESSNPSKANPARAPPHA